MLALGSLGLVTMKNSLTACGLYLARVRATSRGVRSRLSSMRSILTVLVYLPTLASLFLALRLRPSLNSPWENGKQSEANWRTAAACHTQVEGEVPSALAGRSLAVSEQQLADGCEAEMMHADSTVPVSVPVKDRLRASAPFCKASGNAALQNVFMGPFTFSEVQFKVLLEIARGGRAVTTMHGRCQLSCVKQTYCTLLFSILQLN